MRAGLAHLAVVLAAGLAACGGPPRAADLLELPTPPSSADFPSPERGFYSRVDLLAGDDLGRASAAGNTLVHAAIRLDRFRDRPLSKELLAALEQGFARVRRAGLKVVPRFMYNDGPYPRSQPDASEAQILEHIAELAPVLANNADVIVALEAGFVGAWGEWHSSTHGLDKDQGAKQRILAALLAALPTGRQIALRFPHDIARLVGELPPRQAGTAAPTARVGSHQDCFLGSDDDVGTWGFGGRSVDDDKAFIAGRARGTIVGGETCRPSERATCEEALDELDDLHFTYLNQDFNREVIERLRKDGCLGEIRRRLGYRLELRDAATAMRKDRLHFEATVRNAGFAAPVNPRRAYLVLEADGKRHDLLLRARPRTWAAGKDTAVREDLVLPDDLATGVYAVSLWLPDPAPRLRDRAAYAIRLANQGTWVAASGLNRLGEVLITRTKAAAAPEAAPPVAPIGEGALVIDEFEHAWPGANALGNWSGANSFVDGPRGEGLVARGRLALRYQGAGWFSTLIDRDVSEYRWLVLRVRGRDGGEERHIGVKLGGVDAPLARLSADRITTEYGDVKIDLTRSGFDRRRVRTLELYFWRGQPSGRIDLDSIRFEK